MTLNLPLLYFVWTEEYCQNIPKSPNLWHVTSILVCCIFGWIIIIWPHWFFAHKVLLWFYFVDTYDFGWILNVLSKNKAFLKIKELYPKLCMHANTKISRRNEVPTENHITYSNRRKPWGESKLYTSSTIRNMLVTWQRKWVSCALAYFDPKKWTIKQKSLVFLFFR